MKPQQYASMSTVRGKSFAEVVKGNTKHQEWRREMDPNEGRGMDFSVNEEDMGWLQNCYIGYVNNTKAVYLLQDRLIDEGVFTFTINVPMGWDMVLIKPEEGEDFE